MSDPQVPYAQQPDPAVPHGAPMPGAVPRRNFFARHKLLTVLGVVVVLGSAIGIGVGVSKSDDAKPAAVATPTASSGSAESPDGEAEAKPTPDDAANNAKQGTPENPFPIDTPATVGDWTVSVGASNSNVTDAILAEDPFNEPPVDGRQFVMAPITVTFNGKGSEYPWSSLGFKFIGSKGNTYRSLDADTACGAVPNGWQGISELAAGASATANECVSVPTDEIAGGTWVIGEVLAPRNDYVSFAVQ